MILNNNITHIDGCHNSIFSTSIAHNDKYDYTVTEVPDMIEPMQYTITGIHLLTTANIRCINTRDVNTIMHDVDFGDRYDSSSDVINMKSAANAFSSIRGHDSSVSLPARSKCNPIDPMTTTANMHLYDVATTVLTIQHHDATIIHTTSNDGNDDNMGMNYDGQLMTDDDIYQHQNCTVAHTISKDRPSRDYPAVVIDSNQITAYIGGLMLCIIIPSTWLPNTMYGCTVYTFCLNWGVRDYDDDTSKSNSAKSNSASRSASTGTQETLLHAAYHSMPSLT